MCLPERTTSRHWRLRPRKHAARAWLLGLWSMISSLRSRNGLGRADGFNLGVPPVGGTGWYRRNNDDSANR